MNGQFSDIARETVERVLADVGRDDLVALQKALQDAYPFGRRNKQLNMIWTDEIKHQVGTRKKSPAGQGSLF